MANAPPSYGVYREFESHRYYQVWSQSVHGRILACHARGAGSLPAGTAKNILQMLTKRVDNSERRRYNIYMLLKETAYLFIKNSS